MALEAMFDESKSSEGGDFLGMLRQAGGFTLLLQIVINGFLRVKKDIGSFLGGAGSQNFDT